MYVINSMGSMTFRKAPEWVMQITAPQADTDAFMQAHADDSILVLEGGADINPALYGEVAMPYTYFSATRDTREIKLYTAARKYDIPILGICRGHQLMAALDGGTLYQDIQRIKGAAHRHQHIIEFTKYANLVKFNELMESCPTGRPNVVNSLHHQGVRCVPYNGRVLAYAEDRIPEAMWYPYGISVQWHPELLGHVEFLAWMRDTFVKRSNE